MQQQGCSPLSSERPCTNPATAPEALPSIWHGSLATPPTCSSNIVSALSCHLALAFQDPRGDSDTQHLSQAAIDPQLYKNDYT